MLSSVIFLLFGLHFTPERISHFDIHFRIPSEAMRMMYVLIHHSASPRSSNLFAALLSRDANQITSTFAKW